MAGIKRGKWIQAKRFRVTKKNGRTVIEVQRTVKRKTRTNRRRTRRNGVSDYNLSAAERKRIMKMSHKRLEAVKRNINAPNYTDAEAREAVAQYVADGGKISDLR